MSTFKTNIIKYNSWNHSLYQIVIFYLAFKSDFPKFEIDVRQLFIILLLNKEKKRTKETGDGYEIMSRGN